MSPPHRTKRDKGGAAVVDFSFVAEGVGQPASYRHYFLGEAGAVQGNEGWREASFRDRVA